MLARPTIFDTSLYLWYRERTGLFEIDKLPARPTRLGLIPPSQTAFLDDISLYLSDGPLTLGVKALGHTYEH
jgi:hypothetical protein